MFMKNQSFHNYPTRHSGEFHLPRLRTLSALNTFFYEGPKFWNSLKVEIKESPSLNSFKNKLKLFLLQQYSSNWPRIKQYSYNRFHIVVSMLHLFSFSLFIAAFFCFVLFLSLLFVEFCIVLYCLFMFCPCHVLSVGPHSVNCVLF